MCKPLITSQLSGLTFQQFIPQDFTRNAVSQNLLSEISGPAKDIRAGAPLVLHHLTGTWAKG
jgi:hypothetical protein